MKTASIQKYNKYTATNYELLRRSLRSAIYKLIVSEYVCIWTLHLTSHWQFIRLPAYTILWKEMTQDFCFLNGIHQQIPDRLEHLPFLRLLSTQYWLHNSGLLGHPWPLPSTEQLHSGPWQYPNTCPFSRQISWHKSEPPGQTLLAKVLRRPVLAVLFQF